MPTTFRDLIAANKRNTALLVLGFCLFVVAVAVVIGLAAAAYLGAGVNWQEAALVGGGAALLSLLVSCAAYYGGADMVLAVSGARRIEHQDDPMLFNVVEEMAVAAGVPMPAVYMINDPAPNAFATGRDPKHAAIAVTSGLRAMMTRDELQGVIAHEMSHVRNYDIRLMLMLTVLVGTVAMLCDLFWQMLRFMPSRSSSRSSRDDKDGGGGVVALVLILVAVVLAILAPVVAQIIQLAVSRQREYLADASAVELTRYPLGLANALRKIDADPNVLATANRGTAHLYIANPVKKFEERANADSIFASHPPIQERIRRLEGLMK